MKIFICSLLMLLLFSVTACRVEPKPIGYGADGCHFCSMTIVDQQHAAEIVTKKGKAFKFDAVECMMNQLNLEDQSEIALFLVNDYNSPGELIDATKATYLISKNIPSPMGEFLSAIGDKTVAEYLQDQNDGKLFTWAELQGKFKK